MAEAQAADMMRGSLLKLVRGSGEATVDAKWLRQAFTGGKHAREWAGKNRLTVESVKGGTIFRTK